MNTPAFVTSFTGASVRSSSTPTYDALTPRCAMVGDAVAPKIFISKKDLERENSLSVSYETVIPSLTDADTVISNSALSATLRKSARYTSSLATATTTEKSTPPSSVSPSDFYFPSDVRNLAPFISFSGDNSLSVSYAPVETKVSGVSSNDSVPFWEKKSYKWASSAPTSTVSIQVTIGGSKSETLDTSPYESYFPSDIRNVAPYINIRSPVPGGFGNSSIEVGSEYVSFNPKLSSMLEISIPTDEEEETYVPYKAAVPVAMYFGEDRINKAPMITIDSSQSSVSLFMGDVTVSAEQVKNVTENYDNVN